MSLRIRPSWPAYLPLLQKWSVVLKQVSVRPCSRTPYASCSSWNLSLVRSWPSLSTMFPISHARFSVFSVFVYSLSRPCWSSILTFLTISSLPSVVLFVGSSDVRSWEKCVLLVPGCRRPGRIRSTWLTGRPSACSQCPMLRYMPYSCSVAFLASSCSRYLYFFEKRYSIGTVPFIRAVFELSWSSVACSLAAQEKISRSIWVAKEISVSFQSSGIWVRNY